MCPLIFVASTAARWNFSAATTFHHRHSIIKCGRCNVTSLINARISIFFFLGCPIAEYFNLRQYSAYGRGQPKGKVLGGLPIMVLTPNRVCGLLLHPVNMLQVLQKTRTIPLGKSHVLPLFSLTVWGCKSGRIYSRSSRSSRPNSWDSGTLFIAEDYLPFRRRLRFISFIR